MEGANKALLMLGGKPFVTHVADRLRPQVDVLGINANRDLEAFLEIEFDLSIAADGVGGSLGPLDGILGAMQFAGENGCSRALTVSVDTPFLPLDLVDRFSQKPGDQISIASSNARIHGTCGLWPTTHFASLKAFILSGKSLKLMDYLNDVGFIEVAFNGDNPDPFFNINTPEDLAVALRWL